MAKVGCTYELRTARGAVLGVARVLGPPNPVDGLVPVVFHGQEMRLDMCRYRAVRVRRGRKTSTDQVYVYLCKIGPGVYKLGASAAPERRRRELRTCARDACMLVTARLPHHESRSFRAFERHVLDEFAHCKTRRGGSEVLLLSPSEVQACKACIYTVCARGLAT